MSLQDLAERVQKAETPADGAEILRETPLKPIIMNISYLKPLAIWYQYMTETQKKDLPIRVLNALDSLHTVMEGRI